MFYTTTLYCLYFFCYVGSLQQHDLIFLFCQRWKHCVYTTAGHNIYRYIMGPGTQWVIPENIHTMPRVASWNSERGGWGVTQFGILKTCGGGVRALNSVNFQRKDSERSA